MQIEVNAEGFKVRIRLGDTWSRWYNGTEFAGVRNLVRSAEQTKFWIEQELRRANDVVKKYDDTKRARENEAEKKYDLDNVAMQELKKELGKR